MKVVGAVTEYVCAVCRDDHPVRDDRGVVLSKERLAALSYTVHHDGGGTGG